MKFHPDGLLVECSREEWCHYQPLLLKYENDFFLRRRGILDSNGTRYLVEFRFDKVLINPSILWAIGLKPNDIPVMKSWGEVR